METIVKKLQAAEIKRRSVCIPKDKRHLFPGIGEKFTLKDEAKQKIIFNLDKLRVERKRYEEDSVKEYRQLQFRLYNRLKSEVLPIIENVAKEQGFAIVFDLAGSSVAYYNPAFDITAEVINRYNASKAKQE